MPGRITVCRFLPQADVIQIGETHTLIFVVHPSAPMRGLLNAILSVGSIVAIPISPYLADWRGRRLAIVIGLLIMFVGVALQTASQNIQHFIAARFLVNLLSLGSYFLVKINIRSRLVSASPSPTALLLFLSRNCATCNIVQRLPPSTIQHGTLDQLLLHGPPMERSKFHQLGVGVFHPSYRLPQLQSCSLPSGSPQSLQDGRFLLKPFSRFIL